MSKFIEIPIITLILMLTSFLNYCLSQIFGSFFLPMTIIPIAVAAISNFELPLILLAGIGLLDDSFCNGVMGVYPLTYLCVYYVLSVKLKDIQNKRRLIFPVSLIFVIVNFLTFSGFNN